MRFNRPKPYWHFCTHTRASELHSKGFMTQSTLQPTMTFPGAVAGITSSQRCCWQLRHGTSSTRTFPEIYSLVNWSWLNGTEWVKSRFGEAGREKGKLGLRQLTLICEKWAEGKGDPSPQRSGDSREDSASNSFVFKGISKDCCSEMKLLIVYIMYIIYRDIWRYIFYIYFSSNHLYKLEHFSMHCRRVSTFLWLRKVLNAYVWKAMKR